MFVAYSKYIMCLTLIAFPFGCSPFLDDPAPYPPDPSLQDQMLVDSTLRLDQFVPNSSPVPMNGQNDATQGGVMGGVMGGAMGGAMGGVENINDDVSNGGMMTGGEMNLEENTSPLWIIDYDEDSDGSSEENEGK